MLTIILLVLSIIFTVFIIWVYASSFSFFFQSIGKKTKRIWTNQNVDLMTRQEVSWGKHEWEQTRSKRRSHKIQIHHHLQKENTFSCLYKFHGNPSDGCRDIWVWTGTDRRFTAAVEDLKNNNDEILNTALEWNDIKTKVKWKKMSDSGRTRYFVIYLKMMCVRF